MIISNVGLVSLSMPVSALNWFQRSYEDFGLLSTAVQSGDLRGAKQALAAFLKDIEDGSQTAHTRQTSRLFSGDNQAGVSFKALQSALQSGDLAAAQATFATLKQALQGVKRTRQAVDPVWRFNH